MTDGDLPLLPTRSLAAGQRTEVWVLDLDKDGPELVYTSADLLLEAPNWAPAGHALLLNGHGRLWRLELGPGGLAQVPIADLPAINNDHVLDAPRGLIYLSANDGHLYVAPLGGGRASRVSHDPDRYHFLHGVSPDGTTLAFVELPRGDFSAAGPARPDPGGRRRDQLSGGGSRGTWTGPSTPRTAPGSTSTPRSSAGALATPRSPGSGPAAASSNG